MARAAAMSSHGGIIRVQIDLLGEDKIDAILKGLTEKVRDFTPLWKMLNLALTKQEKAVFATEGAYDGYAKWAPLSDNPPGKGYRSWKEKHYPGQPILVLTGRLKRSLTETGAEGAVREYHPRWMRWGSDVRVGSWSLPLLHQLGTVKMPVRKPFEFGQGGRLSLNQAIARFARRFMITPGGEPDVSRAQAVWRRG